VKKGQVIGVILTLILVGGIIYSSIEISLWVDRRIRAEVLRANFHIVILHDRDFTKYYNFTGSGTETDPYIIENLQIHSNKDIGIWIEKTTKHFVIRNCTISQSSTCIFLSEIASHTAIIKDCLLRINNAEVNPYGSSISIDYCSGVDLINNTCIGPLNVSNWFTSENDKRNSGIRLWVSPNCRVMENNCTSWKDGIWIAHSDNTLISKNNLSKNRFIGIYGYSSSNLIISSNICHNNSFGLELEGISFSTISYNDLFFNKYELYHYGYSSTIFSNNCSFNSNYGLIFSGGDWCQISENHFKNNSYGMFFYGVDETNITKNNFEFNSHYSLEIYESTRLLIFQNNFIGNCYNETLLGHPQAFEELRYSQINYWYDNSSSVGNFWSDLVWDETAVYYIDGSNNTDLYPLENPVSI